MVNWSLLALKLSARLPLPVSHFIGGTVGWLASWMPIKPTRTADINLAICFPELAAFERRRLRRQAMANLGKMVLESGRIFLQPAPQTLSLIRQTSGTEMLEQAYREGRGMILATPHIGCWEMAGLWCGWNYPISSLYKPQPGAVNDIILESRERGGGRMFPTDTSGVRALLKALRRHEVVGILPDRSGRVGSVHAPFFGHPLLTSTLAPKLAARSGAPVFFAVCERLPCGRGYHLRFFPGDPEIGSPDEKTAAAALNRSVEKCIRTRPEQYWWTFKMFRRQPPGHSNPYKQKTRT